MLIKMLTSLKMPRYPNNKDLINEMIQLGGPLRDVLCVGAGCRHANISRSCYSSAIRSIVCVCPGVPSGSTCCYSKSY